MSAQELHSLPLWHIHNDFDATMSYIINWYAI